MEPELTRTCAHPTEGNRQGRGVRKALLGSAIALSTLGLTVPAWGAGGAPTKTVEYFPDVTFEIPINNPCTGDPGITTTHDDVRITTWTYADGSKNLDIQDKGTFVFVPNDPTKPTYYATSPTETTQIRLGPDGVGTYKTVGSYIATGTDGSRVMDHSITEVTLLDGFPGDYTVTKLVERLSCP